MSGDTTNTSTASITDWRSIVTLIVFVMTNIIVLFPFHIPIPVPQSIRNALWDLLTKLRIISPRRGENAAAWRFPVDFSTAPLVSVLFLLAILAIGREEVYAGTIGADHIEPIDIMVFFLTLAYIAISIDASGLIRYLAFKVLQKGGKNGRLLFFYLYVFFFATASFVGNDPIVLSGTAFLAYLTRVSSNIVRPTAWIFTQFSIANVASAILVSSNPTNLVLAGAFRITFIKYTANMIVPVVVTAIVLCPFLLYVIFPNEALIPRQIELHDLPEERKNRAPVNPNIPNARAGKAEEENDDEEEKLLSLEEIMNPFLDKKGAMVGALIMAGTLVAILVLNATSGSRGKNYPVFYVTLPAAALMLCWDLSYGWIHRKATQETISQLETEVRETEMRRQELAEKERGESFDESPPPQPKTRLSEDAVQISESKRASELGLKDTSNLATEVSPTPGSVSSESMNTQQRRAEADEKGRTATSTSEPTTLQSLYSDMYKYAQVTFPTVTAVFAHLPFALIPFGLCMFVLVQALVTKGWVLVFAHGWDHWVTATGPIGAIGGMGFLSVILCNFAGTNIGTTILLCRVVQAWEGIHLDNGIPITERTFWATVYSMAIGVNYGAFSIAFSGALAGMLWRDILARKHIEVKAVEFARVNLPIISVTMIVGLTVLVGEMWLTRSDVDAYQIPGNS